LHKLVHGGGKADVNVVNAVNVVKKCITRL
jgi:hypothetical protein